MSNPKIQYYLKQLGDRRYQLKQKGYGGQTRPILRKKVGKKKL